MVRRLALALLLPLLLVLVLAGAFTLVTGRAPQSLVRPPLAPMRVNFDEERNKVAASMAGKFRGDVDPRVGYTLRAGTELDTLGVPFHTDELGLRARTAPPPADGARRIAVVGDSVAFGVGVTDAECFAQQLEDALAVATGDPGAHRVVCRDVAIEGWNWRNEIAFLRDHLDELRPDIVLLMPIGNDLSNTEGIWETGHHRLVPDLESGDPWLYVNLNQRAQWLLSLQKRVEHGELSLGPAELGATVLNDDLGGESTRRHDAMADGIAALASDLAAHGIRFAVLLYEPHPFVLAVVRRLARTATGVPVIPLLDEVRPGDRLATDPHPNAKTDRVIARWTAQTLVDELHWIDASAPVPEADADYAARRAPRRSLLELDAFSAASRDAARSELVAAIEPPCGRGINQIYGGISPSSVMGARALVALPREGSGVEVVIEPLPGRPDLLPLRVTIEADGVVVGALALPSGSASPVSATIALALPSAARPDGARIDTVDLRLVPDRFVTIRELGGFDLASCRVLRIARTRE
jgi:lysophospholipase L1-like esterase